MDDERTPLPEQTEKTVESNRPGNPLANAGFLSRVTFAWVYPLLKRGMKRPLEEVDLPDLDILESSSFNRKKIEDIWEKEKNSERKSLGWALFWEYIRTTWWAQVLMFINMTARIGQAWALGLLMEQFGRFDHGDIDSSENNGDVISTKKGYLYAGLLVLCGFIAAPSKQQQFFETYRKGIQLKAGLVAAIYAKTLRLPSVGSYVGDNVTAGHVMNLASNDVERFASTAVTCSFLLLGPVVAIMILLMGFYIIGPVFGVGYCLLFLLIPLQIYFGRRFANLRSKVATATDERVRLISQILFGVRVMKFNGWEKEFEKKISMMRLKEVSLLQSAGHFKALNEALFYISSLTVSVFTFTIHVATGGELSPKNVFTTMTLYNIVQFVLTKHMPNAVMGLSECYISCKRIQALFQLPERKDLNEEMQLSHDISNGRENSKVEGCEVVSLWNATCYWQECGSLKDNPAESSKIAISDASFTFYAKKLYCIIGEVGSGKSALLQMLSGEIPLSNGEVKRNYRSLSYAVQDPWLANASIRDNITMGCAFEKVFYEEVLEACGLFVDILKFPNGDQTLVGDRGVQCSGGQRARIGLARALYCKAEVVLLDDPLSAVDSKVARSLFYCAIRDLAINRCGSCVILVTHQHQFAVDADTCILMDDGKILNQGSFSECVPNGSINDKIPYIRSENNPQEIVLNKATSLTFVTSGDEDIQRGEENSLLQQKEKRVTGIIRRTTWVEYGKRVGGIIVCALFFIMFTATQVSQLVTIVYIGRWGGAPSTEQYTFIRMVLLLTMTVILVSILRAYLSFALLINASRRLHEQMLHSVLRAKIEFFDTNPIGRVINRFSADLGICDEMLPLTIYDFLVGVFVVIGSVGVSIVVLPFILVPLPLLLWYFVKLRKIFVSSSRELKRVEGMMRSPIFAMISESLNGITTIRCNGKIQYFAHKFEELHNAHTRALFSFAVSSRWFAFHLDFLSFILLSMASILAVLFNDMRWFDISPEILGLSLTLLIQISTTNFPWVVRQSAEVTNQMVSVERILEFGSLLSEAPLETQQDIIHSTWPNDNSIIIENITVRYRAHLPTCLHGLSFDIKAGERVGVVGRTGSGKSSLVQTIFRLLEPEFGKIMIGGVDISLLGLHKLRTSMAVIPQSPVLFGGCTVRENLDPFQTYEEATIFEALDAVQMTKAIDTLPFGLETIIAESGSNFSVGQRQLICLARAILLNSKILILDEPTANVDINTDQLLQKTLKEKFSDATIISIAHRLNTIIDYDRIIVLGNGTLLESGTPKELLKEDGHFASMVKNSTQKR